MASVFVMTLADGTLRIFDSLEAIESVPEVKTVTELAGGHAVATLRDGRVLAVRRIALECGASSSEAVLSPPPPLQRCESVISLGVGAPLANEEAISPLLGAVFARTSPFGTSPLPEAAFLRTPERNKPEPTCPGAPARVVRVSPKRARDLADIGARTAALLAAEAPAKCSGCAASGAEACNHRLE